MNEKLSALMDGELQPDELRRVLKEVASDTEKLRAWGRYHVTREVLRQEFEQSAAATLADRVAAQLATEPTVLSPRRTGIRSRATKVVTGMALAASVAAVAIVGVRWMAPDDLSAPQYVASVENADYLRTGSTRWQSVPEDVEENLNAYLVEHSEFSSTASMSGVTSYVRFVGYDSEQ
jgi:sigma-E factor negative regulatory protein RseA